MQISCFVIFICVLVFILLLKASIFNYNSNLEEMLQEKPFCRYRSIKYSTSQQNLLNKKTTEGYIRSYSRQKVSFSKESLEFQTIKKQKNEKNNSIFRIKQQDKQNIQRLSRKCNLQMRSKHSSLFEGIQGQQKGGEEQQIEILSLPRYDEYQPFTNYSQHLQEIIHTFEPILKIECAQVNRIKSQLKTMEENIHQQIWETEKEGRILLANLRLKISKSFEQHSKQIITKRQILIEMKKSFETMKQKMEFTVATLSDLSKSFTS